ncbi:MAG: hypothetical protein JJ856_22595 [Roseibium sp.]|uniref:hypothetical protein n=1 Tax=Roseibium sp. TaxID=1936156 RepID=UPI001B0906A6|nr:hypothetical protein [Roseibium sp.]MBO6932375.1 hypothetical protein [Roseibium sp.]
MKCLALRSVAIAGFVLAANTGLAQEATVDVSAVSGMVVAPVDGDIYRYKAVLVDNRNGGDDLYIFTDSGDGWQQAVYARDIAWRGGMYGQEPWIEVTQSGSLKLYSENSSIGRGRWEQILTIAYRDNVFKVAGYTISYYDTLDPDAAGQCDVNLLTGNGVHNDKKFKTNFKALPVAEWTMDTRPAECAQD